MIVAASAIIMFMCFTPIEYEEEYMQNDQERHEIRNELAFRGEPIELFSCESYCSVCHPNMWRMNLRLYRLFNN